jgi:hypothetical protein
MCAFPQGTIGAFFLPRGDFKFRLQDKYDILQTCPGFADIKTVSFYPDLQMIRRKLIYFR